MRAKKPKTVYIEYEFRKEYQQQKPSKIKKGPGINLVFFMVHPKGFEPMTP